MSKLRHANGFSLVELVAVVAIILIVMAFAMPNLLTAISNVRLQGSASDIASLIQQIRMRAVRDNHFQVGACQPANSCSLFWLDVNRDGVPNASEPQLQLPTGMTVVPDGSGNPAMALAALGFTPAASSPPPSFNASGIPCSLNNTNPTLATVCSSVPPPGFVFFLRGQRYSASAGWAAISVSPAGRTRAWIWNGTSWR